MLNGKTALVTGSSSGIGHAIAIELAKAGANIMMNGLSDENETQDAINAIKQHGTKVSYSQTDVSDAEAVKAMVDSTVSHFGSIDILVNNAGIQHKDPVEDFPLKKWNAIMAVNLSSAFHTMRVAVPYMKKNDFGRIINIASAHGLRASPEKAAYVAAKHGLIGLTKVVALETAEHNITVNTVCPGWVETDMVKKQIQDKADENGTSYETEAKKLVSDKQPNHRFATPEFIGQGVLFLANPDNKFTTGTNIVIDGGWTAK